MEFQNQLSTSGEWYTDKEVPVIPAKIKKRLVERALEATDKGFGIGKTTANPNNFQIS